MTIYTLNTARWRPGHGKTIPGVEQTFALPGRHKNTCALWLGAERIDYDWLKKADYVLDIHARRPGWDYYLRTIQIINRFGQNPAEWPDIRETWFREWLRRQMNWLYKPGVMISFGTSFSKRNGWKLAWFGGICASGLSSTNRIDVYAEPGKYKNDFWFRVKTIGASQTVAPNPFRYNRQETPLVVLGTNAVNWKQVPTITEASPLSVWDGVAIPVYCPGPAWIPGEILH